MKIVIDMQGAQTESRFRGIGRYTLSLVKEMVRQRGDNEIHLVLGAHLPESIEPIKSAFSDLLPKETIHVFQVLGPVMGHDKANEGRRKSAELMYEAFLASLNPDVILVSSLIEHDAVTSIGKIGKTAPTAVILYDLIPLIHSNVYLQDQNASDWYFGKIDHLRRADHLLSISMSSRQEAIDYLNIPPELATNISTAGDTYFKPLDLTDNDKKTLHQKFQIKKDYILYSGDIDWRKDIAGLFHAFSKLPKSIRETYSIVLVGRSIEKFKDHYTGLAKNNGLLENELIFTGYVTDDDLVLIYNACTLFVFPSWHEGFGLPVLEAMSCGKAVIAANSSSLPEVVGRSDALFEPRDNDAMSAKMLEVLANPEFRQELEQHGLAQAKTFSWQATAQRAFLALETLHSEHKKTPILLPLPKRPRLAFISPLPPEKTGIADYAAELLPELARHYDITAIVQQPEVEDAWVRANVPIRDVSWFREHADQFDRVVYQFGNSQKHTHMFSLLTEFPGMVTLHDFFLSGVLAWVMEEQPQHHFAWTRAIYASHGWQALLDRYKQPDPAQTVMDYPCNLPVLQQALNIIVHSDYSCQLAKQYYGLDAAEDWALVPHLRQPVQKQDKTLARKDLGLTEHDFVICSFGVIGATKLNHRLLEAWLASPLAKDATCHLVFVGENDSGDYGQELERKIAQCSVKDRITITGWVDVKDYRTWLAAADLGVQLRIFSRGETSGTVLDCMNYGLPTIVNAHGSMAYLPADSVWILPDEFSDLQLVEALTQLWQAPARRADIGTSALIHIQSHHNPRYCAEKYAAAIESTYSRFNRGIQGLLQALPSLTPPLAPNELPHLAATWAVNFPPKPRKPQLLLDVSALVKTDLWSGIERVTRALLREIAFGAASGWAVEPVYATGDQPGYRYARKFMSRFLNIPDDWAEDAPVEAWQGDIFLGLDLEQGIVVAQEGTLQKWRLSGVSVHFVVYDLLPVSMPEVFPEEAQGSHQRWLSTITRFDGALCISRAVADELYDWLQTFGQKRELPFALNLFHLGADIDNSAPSRGLPSDAPKTLSTFKAQPTFLMVGTIEPRKGCLQTLRAFDLLWQQGIDVNLVIVGKEGWKPLPDEQRRDIPQTVHALRNHAELGKRLFWLEGISDEYLEQVYAHSSCLIGASYDEGFGLPLIEATRHGLPLLVRDIPVFREVTYNQAYFFTNSRSPEVISEAVHNWMDQYKNGQHPSSNSMPHQTWQESAKQVLNAILGERQPYKTWLPDGVRRYWGADPRLHTEIGERREKAMCTTAKAGILIYGSYERIKPGQYQLYIQGTAKHWTGNEWLEVTSDKGKLKHLHHNLYTREAGEWKELFEFNVDTNKMDVEIRFFTAALTELTIDKITCQLI